MRDEDDDILDALADAIGPASSTPPPERIAAFRAEVEASRAPVPSTTSVDRRRWPMLAAAAIALVVALIGATVVATRDGDPAGTVEYAGPLGDDAPGTLTVTETGIGRVVVLDTTALEILPKGEFYQLWFVGPDDSAEEPDRISAGTFHPDPDGRSNVTFAAAVDPALYPTVQITAEPGDGDPSPTLPALVVTDLSG